MEAGVFEIFGTRYYSYGLGLLFVAPFAFWFVASFFRIVTQFIDRKPIKWFGPILSAVCVLLMPVIVFFDVYQIGQQATKLCNEKAGLRVYRTAQTEGVLGLSGIEHWAKYGFEFVEYEHSVKRKIRHYFKNGKPTFKKVDKFLSQYELVETRSDITPRIGVIIQEVKDRNTNEVLGQSKEFSIDGGWADMFFYNLTGFSYSPWICSGISGKRQIYISDLIEVTLNPSQNEQ
jgi:hypothetical protein